MIDHIEHLNDTIFFGVDATKNGVYLLSDMLQKQHNTEATLKWDGSPSIVAGRFPDMRLFIGTKSFFNKTRPTFYASYDAIDDLEDKNLSGKLRHVMEWADSNLPQVEGYMQGDLLFTSDSIKHETLYAGFKPNCIEYRIANTWKHFKVKPNLGVAWHTFRGQFHNQLDFGSTIWNAPMDVSIDLSPQSTYLFAKTSDIILQSLDGCKPIIDYLVEHPYVREQILKILNARIRIGDSSFDVLDVADDIEVCLDRFYDNEIAKKASVDGQKTWKEKRDETIGLFETEHQALIETLKVYDMLNQLKKMLLDQFVYPSDISAHYDDGTTGHEGVVIKGARGSIKLVNQAQFSHHNFKRDARV